MRTVLILLAACAAQPPQIAEPEPPRPVAVRHVETDNVTRIGDVTAVTTQEDGITVITMTSRARIYCQIHVPVAQCSFGPSKCEGECVEVDAMACFRVRRKLTGESETHCYDDLSNCEGIRLRVGANVGFAVDPACVITRMAKP